MNVCMYTPTHTPPPLTHTQYLYIYFLVRTYVLCAQNVLLQISSIYLDSGGIVYTCCLYSHLKQ